MLTASLTFTVSESSLFRPVRERVGRWGTWPAKLIQCGYCLSHWLGLLVVLVYEWELLRYPKGFVLVLFSVIWLSCLQWAILAGLLKWAGK